MELRKLQHLRYHLRAVCRSLMAFTVATSPLVLLTVTLGRGVPTPNAHPSFTKADVEKMLGELSNWGRWGASDQRGTTNLILPAKRKQASALIRRSCNFDGEEHDHSPRRRFASVPAANALDR
jgi:hypothetical protein